jgi:intracellular septation protein A
MKPEKEIKDIETARRKSKQAIPIIAVFLVLVALALWIIARFVSVTSWITVIVLGVAAFVFIGDIINYIYCGQKLKKLGRKKID